MEKQARVKRASAQLKAEIQALAAEQGENIRIAAHNERVRLTKAGEPQQYKRDAFSRMIKAASALADEAASPE